MHRNTLSLMPNKSSQCPTTPDVISPGPSVCAPPPWHTLMVDFKIKKKRCQPAARHAALICSANTCSGAMDINSDTKHSRVKTSSCPFVQGRKPTPRTQNNIQPRSNQTPRVKPRMITPHCPSRTFEAVQTRQDWHHSARPKGHHSFH